MRTSCIYARGITPAWAGTVSNDPAVTQANLKPDPKRLTSFVYDGHGQGYVCGFGSVFMNGRFPDASSFNVDTNYGWMGDYSRGDVNTMGVIRHLLTQLRFATHAYRGLDWLVISDTGGLSDRSSYTAWGQLMGFLKQQGISTLHATPADITAGAYGWDTRPEYFKQFAGVMLLLSGTTAMPNNITRAITDAISMGASFVILQKNNSEGRAPANAILQPIGIEQDQPGYIAAYRSAIDYAKSQYKDHVSWTKIREFHIQATHRISATYRILATGKGTVANVNGQPGAWEAITCTEVTDETDIRAPIFFQRECCVAEGDGYEATFDAPVFPRRPDNWQHAFNQEWLKVDWSSDNALPLTARSKIYFDVRGKSQGQTTARFDTGTVTLSAGFTVIQLRQNLTVAAYRTFNTNAGGQGSAAGLQAGKDMAAYINGIVDGTHVIVVSSVNAWPNRNADGLPKAMYSLGASRLKYNASYFKTGAAYLLFGTKGIVEGTATTEMYSLPATNPVRFTTGFNITDESIPYCCGTDELSRNTIDIQSMVNNGRYARLKYYKRLAQVDGSQKYGIKHVTHIKDTRFKKLDLSDTKNTVVSVENPCIPISGFNPDLDWVLVLDMTPNRGFSYNFRNGYEYIIVHTDSLGQICQYRYVHDSWFKELMHGRVLDSTGANTAVEMFPDNSVRFFNNTSGQFLQMYERRHKFVDTKGAATFENTNEWEVYKPYLAVKEYQLATTTEFLIQLPDFGGEWEYAQRRLIVPDAAHRPRWSQDFWTRYTGTTNLADMRMWDDLNFMGNNDYNGIGRIYQRPLKFTQDRDSQTEWYIDYFTGIDNCPTNSNIPFRMERDREYYIFAVGRKQEGSYTVANIFSPELLFRMRENGRWAPGQSLCNYDAGCVSWDYSGNYLLDRPGIYNYGPGNGKDGSWYWYNLPQSVYMVMSRKMVTWTLDEVRDLMYPEDRR